MPELEMKQIERQTLRAFFADGIMDFCLGFYLLILGGMLKNSLMGLVALLIIFYPAFMKYLKNHYAYSRTGFVSPTKEFNAEATRTALTCMVLGLVALIAVLLISGDIGIARHYYRWIPIFISFSLLGAFIYIAYKTGIARYYVYSALTLASGAYFPFVPARERLDNISSQILALSVPLIIWGLVLFVGYLRRHPKPEGEGENEA
jgi:hypothetical protein